MKIYNNLALQSNQTHRVAAPPRQIKISPLQTRHANSNVRQRPVLPVPPQQDGGNLRKIIE